MVNIIAVGIGVILGFAFIYPDPSGNISFVLPMIEINSFATVFSDVFEILKLYGEMFVVFFRDFPARFELNLLGFIWSLIRDIALIAFSIALPIGTFVFLGRIVFNLLEMLGIREKIKEKKLIGVIKEIVIAIVIGLIVGAILGIIIKPHLETIGWIILGFFFFVYLAFEWFMKNA